MAIEQTQLVRLLMRDRAKLFGYIWSIVRDEHVTEDILQDVSALAIAKREEIESDDHLLGWCRVTARNRCLLAMRDRRQKPASLDDGVLAKLEDQWAEYDPVESNDVVDALRGCIDELTPHARKIITERYAAGLTGTELAARFNQKTKSLYVTISRIHRTLGDCIRRRTSGEGSS